MLQDKQSRGLQARPSAVGIVALADGIGGAGLRHDAARCVVIRVNRVAEGIGRGNEAASGIVGVGGGKVSGIGRGDEMPRSVVLVGRDIAAAVGRGNAMPQRVIFEAVRHGGEVYHFDLASRKRDTERRIGSPRNERTGLAARGGTVEGFRFVRGVAAQIVGHNV